MKFIVRGCVKLQMSGLSILSVDYIAGLQGTCFTPDLNANSWTKFYFFFLYFCTFLFWQSLVYQWTLDFMFLSYVSSLWTNAELWVWFFRLWYVFLSSLFDFAFYGSCFAKAHFVGRSSSVCFKHPSQILFTRDSYTDMHLNIMYCTHLLYCNVFVC